MNETKTADTSKQIMHLTNLGTNRILGHAYMKLAVGSTGYKRTAERGT
jgi:hypothetical protein